MTTTQPTAQQSELEAIRTSAAIFPLTDRAFLRITGSDATRWLNGMVTNNIKDLAPGQGNYNFLLNAQGRIQGDCTIYRQAETSYLLETGNWQLEAVHQHLDKFIIMDDVELSPAYSDEQSLLLIGPQAIDTLRHLALPAPDPLRLVNSDTPHGAVLLLTPAPGLVPAFELRAPTATLNALRAQIDAPEASAEDLEHLRILSATPKFGTDIRNSDTARDLPQETAQTHALHFSKGCYLGQEIVERIHSRGQVHRTFMQFKLTGAMPTLPAPLESNGKPAGELTSAALIDGDLIALGYIRREAQPPITYAGGTAEPIPASKTRT